MKIAILIGTRPGIIKMAPLVKEVEARGVNYLLIHSGQHYSMEMDRGILKDVGLNKIHCKIERPELCISHAQQTAYMLVEIESFLQENKPDILLVCGDANTNLAGALAARKLHVKVGHVESGLRSFDWRMPEEHNRVIIDHISEYLFAPTMTAKNYLIADNVRGEIFVVGNTIVDSALMFSDKVKSGDLRQEFRLPERYALLTIHREENVDSPLVLRSILECVRDIAESYKLCFVFPVHPRTEKMITQFECDHLLKSSSYISLIKPVGYTIFLSLIKHASLVMTDSGGLQEEACILKTPCVTLRESTERPETVTIGANIVAGVKREGIMKAFESGYRISNEKALWKNPYGDGFASRRIIDTCLFGKPGNELTFP